ncbi:30S ribosome-binding factor RbfA [Wolbachia endosymbiont of Dirofilaria (Dirofilaria) immitis]|uniref:30S ribosome-binding factor RbfA n=1 Tax=Wolbachia endosymbiont of Dirofilaria (Dirofilaria) immitis TaxID=1812115 RepID=UPI00158D4093|nr:30S ribosome-binding factor RbfA [Wolbachia endosymbiont of Dirofilaria (Dirofilaria) immitis]QKX02441.1 30S ribosome-binding factor RbfA [Wolbachia endosymbiont of Dirofilaria (Dirofilaria) immitis]
MKKEIRSLKIASVLHRAISRVLIEGKVYIHKNVSVSDVRLSKDFKIANVYIVLPSLSKKNCSTNAIINEINQSAWLIHKSILRYVNLRFVPKLIFKPDLAFDNFITVSKILSNFT